MYNLQEKGQPVKRGDQMSEHRDRLIKPIPDKAEKPISKAYPVIDTDLARDNIENDMPAEDLQDLP